MRSWMISIMVAVCLGGCTVSVPQAQQVMDEFPSIYPDYVGVTVPVNIAPLRFKVNEPVEDAIAVLTYRGEEWVEHADDGEFLFSISDWTRKSLAFVLSKATASISSNNTITFSG